ncbi:acyltransferase family protein [Sulfurimonas sp. HSL1-2]|uniref:acyltransferase family protein n=1 Tax=Thiomicrolovo zhangzhouensis TaxID=3131933 RepID=UPI0031F923BB
MVTSEKRDLSKMNTLSRNIALDILKLVMAFIVIGLHTQFLHDFTKVGNFLTCNGVFRIAVPMFLLINGFYFYSFACEKKYIHWFKRVLFLYLFWMMVYSYFWWKPFEISLETLLAILEIFLVGYLHLWYLAALLGAALIMIIVKKFSAKTLVAAILITFLSGTAIQYAGNYHIFDMPLLDRVANTKWVYRNFLFFAFPFFSIGFFINKYDVHKKISFELSLIVTVIGFILVLGESYLNLLSPINDKDFDMLVSLLILCPILFILFMNFEFKGGSKQFALYASGVYFVHLIILFAYRKFMHLNSIELTLAVIATSLFISFFLIKINSKLKFIL